MDSTSSRDTYPECVYMASFDPLLPHHLATLIAAEKQLGRRVALVVVRNFLKSDRMFSEEESVQLAEQLAQHLGMDVVEIFCLKTRESIAEYITAADVVIRRSELGLDSDAPYIQKMAQEYDMPNFPQKICWINSDTVPQHTAGRFKSLLYVAEHHPKERVRDICLCCAQKIAPDFMIEAVQQKLREQPDRQFFLSITPDLQPFFDTIKKNSAT